MLAPHHEFEMRSYLFNLFKDLIVLHKPKYDGSWLETKIVSANSTIIHLSDSISSLMSSTHQNCIHGFNADTDAMQSLTR